MGQTLNLREKQQEQIPLQRIRSQPREHHKQMEALREEIKPERKVEKANSPEQDLFSAQETTRSK